MDQESIDKAYGRTMEKDALPPIASATNLGTAVIGRLMKAGAMTEAIARTKLAAIGYSAADVDYLIVDMGTEDTPAAALVKKLSEANVGKLLKAAAITTDDARIRFAAMGYPAVDVDYLILIHSP